MTTNTSETISQKKQNQIDAGARARQKGENVKNAFTAKVTNTSKSSELTKLAKMFIDVFSVPKDTLNKINAKAFSDGGKEKSVKSDTSVTFDMFDKKKNIQINTSIKSSFGNTQLAIHSIPSLTKYLEVSFNINMPKEAEEFLYLFTYPEKLQDQSRLPNHSPKYLEKNSYTNRFCLEDIIAFNPKLYESFKEFVIKHAKEIAMFVFSAGSIVKKANWATAIMFTDEPYSRVELYNIEKLVNKAIAYCKVNPQLFIKEGKSSKDRGTTSLALLDGLFILKMKGSGGEVASHNIQFTVSGNRIKKSLDRWGY